MIELLFAAMLQTSLEPARPVPALTAADPCIEIQGRGVAVIDGRRLKGRALARAVAQRLPAGRPLFIRFANERASGDVEGMAAVMAGGVDAPEIVIVQTCDLAAGGASQ